MRGDTHASRGRFGESGPSVDSVSLSLPQSTSVSVLVSGNVQLAHKLARARDHRVPPDHAHHVRSCTRPRLRAENRELQHKVHKARRLERRWGRNRRWRGLAPARGHRLVRVER
jgi:hypothetical protein